MSVISRRDFAGLMAAAGAAFTPIRAVLSQEKPATWVFTGDSITHGALHTMGGRSYVEHFAERLRWEMRRPRDIVINTGISGNRISNLTSDIDWRVFRFKPSVVSLMFGMNDCVAGPDGRETFRKGLGDCLNLLRTNGLPVLVHTPNTIFFPADSARRDLPAYVEIIRDICRQQSTALIDHYEHWTATRKKQHELLVLLGDGAIHPNAYGHIELAHHTMRELGIFDSASHVGRFFVP